MFLGNMNVSQKRFLLATTIVAVFGAALFFTFQPINCGNFDCFQDRMAQCARTSFVHNLDEASWGYEIVGQGAGNTCEIEVTLLSAKKGELDLRPYEGNAMLCSFEYGVISYPERNLNRCSGELKENLQTNIIQRLHIYILDEIGEIDDALLDV